MEFSPVPYPPSPSVVVPDLNVFRAEIGPPEAHPPLIVDPDRVLPCSLAVELFKRSPSHTHEVGRARLAGLLGIAPIEKIFGPLVPERCDHLDQYNGTRNPWQRRARRRGAQDAGDIAELAAPPARPQPGRCHRRRT